eukprot:scaffold531901_cov43-Prasinocladus_malaysianus.AAC.1
MIKSAASRATGASARSSNTASRASARAAPASVRGFPLRHQLRTTRHAMARPVSASAAEVAFWELAPYLPNMKVEDFTEETTIDFIRENAGKAFEFMVDKCNESRAEAGLPPLEEVRAAKSEDPAILEFVDKYVCLKQTDPADA